MSAFIHHLAYDFKTGIRDRSQLLMHYLFPLVFFLLVSGLMVSVNPLFKDLMLPAMALFAMLSSALLSLPSSLVNARETGVFRSFRINGVPSAALLSIPPLGAFVHAAVVSVLIALLGPRLYGGTPPASAAGYFAAGALSYAAIAGIGALIGVASANNRASILAGQFVYLPSIILGGLMFPRSLLPPALARVSLLLPTSHAMRVFESLGMRPGAGAPWLSVGVLASSAVLNFALAAMLFEWDARSRQPSAKPALAFVALVPYAVAAVLG